MLSEAIFIFAVLCFNIVISELLVRKTVMKHIGTTFLVIIITAIVANLGVIPTSSAEAPIYDGIFAYVAPVGIFILLLDVNLRDVLKAGGPMLAMFGLGAVGTVGGVLLGMWLIDGASALGDLYQAIGGMFAGTYVGGSVNFNAVALHYGVAKEGVIFAGSNAVDNIATTIWMAVCLSLPRFITRGRSARPESDVDPGVITGIADDTESMHPFDLALLLGLAGVAVWISEAAAGATGIPSILILTTIALAMAQLPAVGRLQGTRLLGMFAIYLFLAVIGAFCDVAALQEIGALGLALLGLAFAILFVHGSLVFGAGVLLKIDPDVASVASQACFGGPTSALAVARSLGRADLVLPGILVGSLGYGVGTYIGFLVAGVLL